ncbi:hypothetical protein HMPREF2557_01245 [Neisseria sp. HMSC064F03]|nr:hypothetical protein HMPREF2675_06395 [Neisseria sp. HMSC061H08]OHQ18318.1 hypothetical protein HMPREF2557_01245 [Neisseria sp. HMSC064F03]
MQQTLPQTIRRHTDLKQNAQLRRHRKSPAWLRENSALVMGRLMPLTAKIRKAETFAKVPQVSKRLGRTLGIWGNFQRY